MEVTEVRIGNYVLGQDGSFPVHLVIGIDHSKIKTQPLNLISWQSIESVSYLDGQSTARPIVITDDWLIKLGFKSNSESDRFWYPEKNFWVTSFKGRYSAHLQHDKINDIQFINQLQNLFFTVTSEELTIKEPAV